MRELTDDQVGMLHKQNLAYDNEIAKIEQRRRDVMMEFKKELDAVKTMKRGVVQQLNDGYGFPEQMEIPA